MAKRTERDNDLSDTLHPAKLVRRMSDLRLAAPDPDTLPPGLADDEMDGVDARDFIYLNRRDMLDAIHEVEIDDRFMKIPRSVSASNRDVPYFERPTQALIPYRGTAESTEGGDDLMADD